MKLCKSDLLWYTSVIQWFLGELTLLSMYVLYFSLRLRNSPCMNILFTHLEWKGPIICIRAVPCSHCQSLVWESVPEDTQSVPQASMCLFIYNAGSGYCYFYRFQTKPQCWLLGLVWGLIWVNNLGSLCRLNSKPVSSLATVPPSVIFLFRLGASCSSLGPTLVIACRNPFISGDKRVEQ